MPVDGLTLSFIRDELQDKILGGRVEKVSQPEKDMLVVLVRNEGQNHRVLITASPNQARIQLTRQTYENPQEPPMFCMLMRKHLVGSRIVEISQKDCDRTITIVFDCIGELGDHVNKTMIIEMMGRYSNITLIDADNIIIDCIRHVNREMSRVRVLLPGSEYLFQPSQDKLNPFDLDEKQLTQRLENNEDIFSKALIANISGIAKVSASEICNAIGVEAKLNCKSINLKETANALIRYFQNIKEKKEATVLYDPQGQSIDFFPYAYSIYNIDNMKKFDSLSEAMDEFYAHKELFARMKQRSANIQKQINNHISRLNKKTEQMHKTINESDKAIKNKIYGDLITANIYKIEKGIEKIEVINYYEENEIVTIELSPYLSAAKNAQNYYKKYRKAKGAQEYAKTQLSQIEDEIDFLESSIEDIEKCTSYADLDEIKLLLEQSGYVKAYGTKKYKKKQKGEPYKFYSEDGTEILVGKNAVQNDRLTLHARGDDYWLHAQGIHGSHVIIHSDIEPNDNTIVYAAKIATYFSKGKNHPNLPVDYTKRKYVKKAAGKPAGFVTYTNFKTVLVGLTKSDIIEIQNTIKEKMR